MVYVLPGLIADIFVLAVIIFVIRSKFWKRTLLITYFTLVLTQVATWIASTDFFSFYVYPENLALQDFDLADYAMANLRSPKSLDDRIVLVNIGIVPRRDIAREISLISGCHPKVIGVDAFFNCDARDSIPCPQGSDTLGNSMLSQAIQHAKNVVLVSRLLQKKETESHPGVNDEMDSVEISDPIYSKFATNGFGNLPVQEGRREQIELIREMVPREKVVEKELFAFSVEIARRFDSVKTAKFLSRQNTQEVINFRRNIDLNKLDSKYSFIDVTDLLGERIDTAKLRRLIQGKIVIMGFLGSSYGDATYDNVFYTPFNKISFGRALPDMFGVILHANIVSMILDQDYINVVPPAGEWAIGFLTCALHVALLLYISRKFPSWFDIMAVGLVVLQLFLGSWIRLTLFTDYNVKVQLYITIASLAIASIAINISKELYHKIRDRLPLWLERRL